MNTQTPKQVVDAIRNQMRGSGFAGQSADRVRVMIEYIEELERQVEATAGALQQEYEDGKERQDDLRHGLRAALAECERMQAQIAGLTALNRSFEARQRAEKEALDQMENMYRRERDEAIKRMAELEAQSGYWGIPEAEARKTFEEAAFAQIGARLAELEAQIERDRAVIEKERNLEEILLKIRQTGFIRNTAHKLRAEIDEVLGNGIA